MKLGMIGLGRMGSNMAQRLLSGGHKLVVFDPQPEAMKSLIQDGAEGADSAADLVSRLSQPRAIWLMVPSGNPTEETIANLAKEISPGDVIVDGGNSYYKDSMRRAAFCRSKGIIFMDAGVSGGIWGREEGYCLMVGGDEPTFKRLEPIFQTLAPTPDCGYGHVGPSGAGHFVKMIHNGIEYGLMESYAEGFGLMQAKPEFKLELPQIAELWRHGSVVRSWLLDLATIALKQDPKLEKLQPYVEDSGEGRWTVEEAINLAVPVPVISESLQVRFRSRESQSFGEKLLAALRYQFGGHPVKKSE